MLLCSTASPISPSTIKWINRVKWENWRRRVIVKSLYSQHTFVYDNKWINDSQSVPFWLSIRRTLKEMSWSERRQEEVLWLKIHSCECWMLSGCGFTQLVDFLGEHGTLMNIEHSERCEQPIHQTYKLYG